MRVFSSVQHSSQHPPPVGRCGSVGAPGDGAAHSPGVLEHADGPTTGQPAVADALLVLPPPLLAPGHLHLAERAEPRVLGAAPPLRVRRHARRRLLLLLLLWVLRPPLLLAALMLAGLQEGRLRGPSSQRGC